MEESYVKRIKENLTILIEKARHYTCEVNELYKKVQQLSDALDRSSLPEFPGIWTEQAIHSYINRLREAIEEPLIARSKTMLISAGIAKEHVDTIPKESLRNIDIVEELCEVLRSIRRETIEVLTALIEEGILTKWLNTNIKKAVEIAKNALEHKEFLTMFIDLKAIIGNVWTGLFEKAVEDPKFIERIAESGLFEQVAYLKKVGLVVTYEGSPDSFCKMCETIFQDIYELENKYGLSTQEVRRYVGEKHLKDAMEILSKVKGQIQHQVDKLKKQLHELASILGKRLDELVEENNVHKLEKKINEFEKELERSLGEPSLKLLNFLRGREEFPDDLTKEQLKEALIKLRPFIRVRHGGEGTRSD